MWGPSTQLSYDAAAWVVLSPSGRVLAEGMSLTEACAEFPGEPLRVFNGHVFATTSTRSSA